VIAWDPQEELTVCLVGEPRERSGAAPLPRLFGWGAVGAERLPGEYSPNMWARSVPRNLRDGAAPLRFLLSRLLPSPSVSLVSAPEVPNLVSMAELPGLARTRRRSPAQTPVAGGASTFAVGGARPPVALPAARDPAWDEVEEDADMWDPLNSTLCDM
jgi:hypothetical protein